MSLLLQTVRIIKILAILLFAVVALLVVYGTSTRSDIHENFSMPGHLVDVGGHNLHFHCVGEGEQAVVLESGGGSWSLDWFPVIDGLSSFSKVCVYDRAGFGWSDTAEGTRDFQTLVSELDRLLINSGTSEPLILVGASLGGAIVQMYAQQFPDKVAGLLLLDARAKRSVTDLLAIEPSLLPPPVVASIAQLLTSINVVHGILKLVGTEGMLSVAHPNLAEYPEEIRKMYLDSRVFDKNIRATLAEAIADAQSELQLDAVSGVGDIPLIVVTHGYEYRFDSLELSEKQRGMIEKEWARQQYELSSLSSDSKIVVAESSGHLIQLDQPALVVELVKELVEAIEEAEMAL
jgi:pimeloyl-ACP methyl ester carboxylesterase